MYSYNEILSSCSKEWERREDPYGRISETYPSKQSILARRPRRPHGCRTCKLHVNCDVQLVGAEESIHYKSSIIAVLLQCFGSISACPALMVYNNVIRQNVLCFVPLSIRKFKMYSGLCILLFHLIWSLNVILLPSFSFLATHLTREMASAVHP